MNTQTINKVVLASTAILSLALIPSCAVFDPNYAAYKKQQAAQTAGSAVASANPYGVPAVNTASANPYAVPGANGETGSVPYQPIPGVTNTPTPNIVQSIPTPTPIPSTQAYTPLPQESSASASTHIVEKGDTIWGLTRKYGVTGDALRTANNLQTDTIWVGQRLSIPAR